MKKHGHWLLLILLVMGLVANAQQEICVYPYEDFETSFLPGVSVGRGEAKGSVLAEDENVYSGKRAARLQWDLSICPPDNGFVNYTFQKQLLGQVQSVKAWVYTPDENLGSRMMVWIEDATGQLFIPNTKLNKAGWHQYVFPVWGQQSPWKSGAGDNVQHLPLKIRGFAIEEPGTKGYVIIDGITVETKAEPRELIEANLTSVNENYISWGEKPKFDLEFSNFAASKVELLLLSLAAVDRLTGEELWSDFLLLPALPPGEVKKLVLEPEIESSNNFIFEYTTSDDKGVLSGASGSVLVAKMFGRANEQPVGSAEENYVTKWGLLGGVFWQCTPQRARDTGAVWERHWTPWSQIEREPGVFDFSAAIEKVDQRKALGMDLVYFNTIYEQPKFYPNDQGVFAPAYGKLHQELTKAMGERINWYELGNEDNGPSKFIYTEIARNGAAGVRSQHPYAMIANSGTAQIDTGWLRMQAKRGLFQRLDALVTHPYTWTSTPEEYGVLEQLADVEQIIDDLGGMKFQYTTEFGYDHIFDQEKRANWIPRHFAIGAAAGLLRHGLYAWDGHFGIYDNGKPFPAAVSVNAYSNFTRGHQFAGWLKQDDQGWVMVFERAGIPLVMAWTPKGEGSFSLEGETSLQIFDRNGNLKKDQNHNEIILTESPIYIKGSSSEITKKAWLQAAKAANERYKQVLAKSELATKELWSDLANNDLLPFASFQEALAQWQPKEGSLSLADQAVIAQTLRRGLLMARIEGLTDQELTPPALDPKAWERWYDYLARSVAVDLDQPALRWLLWNWEKLNDELAMIEERGETTLANSLARMPMLYDQVARQLALGEEKLFFSIWPYIYASAPMDEAFNERSKFVPDRGVPVGIRLNSYANQSYDATVRLELPSDWKTEPEKWEGTLEPGEIKELTFSVIAGSTLTERIYAVLSVPGKPSVRIPYDDFEVLPALGIEIPVISKFLPNSPLKVKISNYGENPISGRVRLLVQPEASPLASIKIENLAPGGVSLIDVELPKETLIPQYNQWLFYAHFTSEDGKQSLIPIHVDFDVVAQSGRKVEIDGELNEWLGAAPLNLNKEEYTFGTFGAGWSEEDLSGIIYTLWDKDYLYIAADVTDQLFHQELADGDVWNQDSVQFALAPEGGPITEFSMALTPKGPQVWRFDQNRLVDKAKLAVKLLPGRTVYECAIPWSEIPQLKAEVDAKGVLRFDVLLNDHDAIVARRAMGRYGIGILHEKNYNLFGYLHFTKEVQLKTSKEVSRGYDQIILSENFEEYEHNATPDLWQEVVHLLPPPEIRVKDGMGRAGSKALILNNLEGKRDFFYCNLVRELKGLESGKTYLLQAWVRGAKVDTPGAILGICSDIYGNEGFSFVPGWEPSEQWQLIQWEFKAPGGHLNLIIRNNDFVEDFAIDSIVVIKKE